MSTRLVSLREMLKVYAAPYYHIGQRLESLRMEALLKRDLSGDVSGLTFSGPLPDQVQAALTDVKRYSAALGLGQTVLLVSHIEQELSDRPREASEVQVYLRTLDFTFGQELEGEWLLQIDRRKRTWYEHEALFGLEVATAFPSAKPDIREAGSCLATDRNTAAVFHLMRAVEWGLRALGADLGVRRLRSRHKKSGKLTYKPLSYSEWEVILNTLQAKVDAKIQKTKRGPAKQSLQEFYHPAIQDVKGIRDAWRNHVMHTRREYSGTEAEAVMGYVSHFMRRLATRVSEV